MSIDEGLLTWVEEALEPIGKVSMRKMMGGATLYLDGIIFAIMHGGELWLKADKESDLIWDEAGCEKFAITLKDGWVDVMNYRRAPADTYDDVEEMQRWTRLAIEAGMRRPPKKRSRKHKKDV
jgi:DNA transformation protein